MKKYEISVKIDTRRANKKLIDRIADKILFLLQQEYDVINHKIVKYELKEKRNDKGRDK